MDERVDPAEAIGHLLQEPQGGILVDQVERPGLALASGLLDVVDDRGGGRMVAVEGESDVAAPLGQHPADGGSEAAASAGHDGGAGT